MSTTIAIAPHVIARARRALQLMYVADALSLPVHWFYEPSKIVELYGPNGIEKYEKAPEKHIHNFMTLRPRIPGVDKDVTGDVILKGKKEAWIAATKDENNNVHVHQGMEAGDNTLNLVIGRWLTSSLASVDNSNNNSNNTAKLYNQKQWLDKFITLMTTEGSHPDSYSEGIWKNFFSEYLKQQIANNGDVTKIDLTKLGVKDEDNYSAGSLMTVAPLIIGELIADRNAKRVQQLARNHANLYAPDDNLPAAIDIYVSLIDALLFRENDSEVEKILHSAVSKFVASSENFKNGLEANRDITTASNPPAVYERSLYDVDSKAFRDFGLSCPLEYTWPTALYLVLKYYRTPHLALLGNVNQGGENCHRGAVLGSILGLVSESIKSPIVDGFIDGLKHKSEINSEIDALLSKAASIAGENRHEES